MNGFKPISLIFIPYDFYDLLLFFNLNAKYLTFIRDLSDQFKFSVIIPNNKKKPLKFEKQNEKLK